MATNDSGTRRRLITLLALLPLVPALITAALFHHRAATTLEASASSYGQSTAHQIAGQVAAHLVEADLLSLTVIASRMTREEPVRFVAIYDDKDRLVAQSGKSGHGIAIHTADVTFQDSLVGRVQVMVADEGYSVNSLIRGLVLVWLIWLVLIYWRAEAIFIWLGKSKGTANKGSAGKEKPRTTEVAEAGPIQECIAVIRIKPAHHLESHFDSFYQAASLHGGIVEQTTPEELVIHFEGRDAIYLAICTGLLIQQTASQISGNISFGSALGMSGDKPDKVRKSTSYLASIAEGELILASDVPDIKSRVQLQPFHHMLVDSDSLFRIVGLVEQKFQGSSDQVS